VKSSGFFDESGATSASDEFTAPDDATTLRVAAAIGQSRRDAHCEYLLSQGARHLYGSRDKRPVLARNMASKNSLAPEAQESEAQEPEAQEIVLGEEI
jgi:hypothetical protein